ncbi:hypothetical protein EC973_003946 [Apophysomyces ossiformis]|uniref:Invertebrate defensins family profile domain-containing protein n=1 Tax=Apophysomyces ossiformis TaxID=679940 RepID=A0A8H7ELQ9_9FUNG|nr:hypothetical protein EC973_003946 [Apophysomyces ossiformis]
MRFNLLLGVAYAYVATTTVSAAVMKEVPSQSVSMAVDTASKSMESMVAKASGSEVPRWSGKLDSTGSYGCPHSDWECIDYCKWQGYKGGHCGRIPWAVCKCR